MDLVVISFVRSGYVANISRYVFPINFQTFKMSLSYIFSMKQRFCQLNFHGSAMKFGSSWTSCWKLTLIEGQGYNLGRGRCFKTWSTVDIYQFYHHRKQNKQQNSETPKTWNLKVRNFKKKSCCNNTSLPRKNERYHRFLGPFPRPSKQKDPTDERKRAPVQTQHGNPGPDLLGFCWATIWDSEIQRFEGMAMVSHSGKNIMYIYNPHPWKQTWYWKIMENLHLQ